jgi:hypothetical protein
MTERTFTLACTEEERTANLFAIGFALVHLKGTAAGEILQRLTAKLAHLVASDCRVESPNNPVAPSGTEAARAMLSPPPVELRDRWQRNKKGEEVPNPDGYETHTVDLWKAESAPTREGKPRWKITWPSPNGQGYIDGSCFDEKLFPFLANRVKQRTTIYVVRNGKYLNVVGVRA